MKLFAGGVRLLAFSLALSPAAVAAQQGQQPPEPTPDPWEDGRQIYRSEDGRFLLRLDGRLFLDAAVYDENKNPLSNGTEVRRGRLSTKATIWEVWRTEFDLGFEDNEVEIKDAWISYDGFGSTSIQAGQFKEPFSLEELTSSRYIVFMERSLVVNALAPGRHLGVGTTTWRDHWQFSAGLFGQEIGDEAGIEDQGYGIAARFTVAPIQQPRRTLHLGVAATRRTPDADEEKPDRVRFRTRPETHVNRERFLNTGRMKDVDYYELYGLELAAVVGPYMIQGEYMQADVTRMAGRPDVTVDGAYVYVSWVLSGESRPYVPRLGEFWRLVPKKKSGAWELALRYSTLDLNDLSAEVTGGEGENFTLGVNWYPNPHIRVMANYIEVDNDEFADANGDAIGGDDFSLLQVRFQVMF
jgi:phosphate-selective porin OprO/OprP